SMGSKPAVMWGSSSPFFSSLPWCSSSSSSRKESERMTRRLASRGILCMCLAGTLAGCATVDQQLGEAARPLSSNAVYVQQVPFGHFLVVVGLDPDDKSVIAYSGKEKNQRIPYERFKHAWEKTNYWSLLIEPTHVGDTGT